MMASRPLPCAIEIIAPPEGFLRLRPEWVELLSTSPSDSLLWAWERMFT
jgi:hypothetical protein